MYKCRILAELLYWIELDCTSVPVLKRTKLWPRFPDSEALLSESGKPGQYNFFLPYGLHTAYKALEGTLDEDCIDVLLQLPVQDVNMRHDQMTQLQKKPKVFILQHRQEARCLSNCNVVK